MAKKDQQKTNGTGRVKFRYADGERYFDLDVEATKHEGGIVEGLKSIANALAGRTIASAAARALPANPPTTSATAAPPPEEVQSEEGSHEEGAPVGADIDDAGAQKSRKKYVPKAPTFLSDLDLSTAQVSLHDFAKQKNPTDMGDRYVVVATWFKEHMNTDEINIDHIFTAFRTLEWKMPDDPASVFRTLKHKKQYFDKGESIGGYKVTFLATNYAAKMGTSQ